MSAGDRPLSSYYHRAAVLLGWRRATIDGVVGWVRPAAEGDDRGLEYTFSIQEACVVSGLPDFVDVLKLLRRFSN